MDFQSMSNEEFLACYGGWIQPDPTPGSYAAQVEAERIRRFGSALSYKRAPSTAGRRAEDRG
jgi:hypothetical protein